MIQRDEETCQPKLFYEKLPVDIADRWVLLLDPMFATGNYYHCYHDHYYCYLCRYKVLSSPLNVVFRWLCNLGVEVLKVKGVPEDHILFLNLIASPSGVADFARRFPKLRVVTAFIDQGLDEKKGPEFISLIFSRTDARHIIPGLGDFGDRYYTL